MKLIKSLVISFSLFSKIPVPNFDWNEEDMQYMFFFFPWIGAIIGALIYGWSVLCDGFSIGILPYTLILCVIPLIVTGGIHMDGFMDCMDAFNSYKSREEKLLILKDPHIGAFCVIKLAAYGLIFLAAASLIDKSLIGIFAICFFASRCYSGLAALTEKSAKSDGMLFTFASNSKRAAIVVKVGLLVQLIVSFVLMLSISLKSGVVVIVVMYFTYLYYIQKCRRILGGITGDTEGYFVCITELAAAVALAVCKVSGIA